MGLDDLPWEDEGRPGRHRKPPRKAAPREARKRSEFWHRPLNTEPLAGTIGWTAFWLVIVAGAIQQLWH